MATTEKILLKLDLDTEDIGSELRKVRAQYQETLVAVKRELQTYEKLVRITRDTIAQKGDKTGKLTQQLVTYETELRRLKTQQRDLQHQIDLTTRAEDAQGRSYNQVSALARLKKAALNELAGTMQRNADGTITLTSAYAKFSQTVKTSNDGLIAFDLNVSSGGRNVGNYTNSIMALKDRLRELKAAAETMDVGSEQFKATRAEILKITSDIQQLSGEYDEFGQKVKRNPMAEAMGDLAAATTGAISAIQLFTLVTADNASASEVQAKALKAIAIAQAADNVQKGLAKIQGAALAIQMRALTVAQQAHTAAISANVAMQRLLQTQLGLTAGAARVLATALAATGITALVAGIGLLISYINNLIKAKKGASSATSDLVAELEKELEILQIIGGTLEEQRDLELRINEAKLADYREKMASKKKLNDDEQQEYKKLIAERELIDIRYHANRRKREEEIAQAIKDRQISILETELQIMQIRDAPLTSQLQMELNINKAKLDSYADLIKSKGELDAKEQLEYQRLLNERRIIEERLAKARKEQSEEIAKANMQAEQIRHDTEIKLMQIRGESQGNIIKKEIQLLEERMDVYEQMIVDGKQLTADQMVEYERLVGELKIKRAELDEFLKQDSIQQLRDQFELETAELETQRLLGVIKEEKYRQQLQNITNNFYTKQLELLKQNGLEGTLLYTRLRNEQLALMKGFNQQEIEETQKLTEAQIQLAEMRKEATLDIVQSFGEVIRGQKQFALLSLFVDKAFTIARIIINLQNELSAIAAKYALLGPAAVAAASGIAKARAATRIGVVLATTIGEAITIKQEEREKKARGGVVKMYDVGGRLHSEGGTLFVGEDGTMFEAERDEVITVVNRRSAPTLRLLSQINVMGGGVPFFAHGGVVPRYDDGGMAARVAALPVAIDNTELINALNNLKLFVSVTEINDVQAKVKAVQSRATV